MLTYVINTSENKTFDSDQLFKHVGYNKIRWMNYNLNELDKCAKIICEKQRKLGADDFRIAILVDFYSFDRVRRNYGSLGYIPEKEDEKVDLCIYFPFLEAYIVDHLFAELQRKELFVRERHVFYIQDSKSDGFNVLDNKEEQVANILEPVEILKLDILKPEEVEPTECEEENKYEEGEIEYYTSDGPKPDEDKSDEQKDDNDNFSDVVKIKVPAMVIRNGQTEFKDESGHTIGLYKREIEQLRRDLLERLYANKKSSEEQVDIEQLLAANWLDLELDDNRIKRITLEIQRTASSTFSLHCTEDISLKFSLTEYPYTDKKTLTYQDFFRAFKLRESQQNGIKRHHFFASFGGGEERAALDNLSLQLYLIKLYEREESLKEKDEFLVVDSIEPGKLKKLLVDSWNKINSARTIAINNSSQYYDIRSMVDKKENKQERDEKAKTFSKSQSSASAHEELKKLTVDGIYKKICEITDEKPDSFTDRDKGELDKLMAKYLQARDDTKESVAEDEFQTVRETCATTNQCPSQNDYENVVARKKATIADLLTETINAEYISKDYTEQRKKAEEKYKQYLVAKSSLGKSLFGDIGLWVFILCVMLIPFMAIGRFNFEYVMFYVLTAGAFTGLFALVFVVRIIPLICKMNRAKSELKLCFVDCRVKQDFALFNYKRRYEEQLIQIENLRYDLRNITKLYKYNLAKNRNIERHRKELEELENTISAMLNNLGVEPEVVRFNDLTEEFDVNKSIRSNANKIYKIFSIDAIEALFETKEKHNG